jgi:GntR family transcriptional repressor for pyruvate dehydrogenase complex
MWRMRRAKIERSVVLDVQRALEAHLVDGSWGAGTRLPAERRLAEMLGVSRNSVREAILALKTRGLLASRRGSGVFVTERLQTAIASPWRQLVVDHPDMRWDTLEFRRELEAATAHYAALRATPDDLATLVSVVERLEHAYVSGNKPEEHRADADFHEAIAQASHNSMFLYLHSSMVRMLREHISFNLEGLDDPTGKVTARLREQHLRIWDAIRRRQAEAARKAMLRHVDFTRDELVRRESK